MGFRKEFMVEKFSTDDMKKLKEIRNAKRTREQAFNNLKNDFETKNKEFLKKVEQENEILKQSGKTLAEGVCKQNELATTYKQALEEIRERCQTILENSLNHPQSKLDFAESLIKTIKRVLNDGKVN